jgi:hypothetical protein
MKTIPLLVVTLSLSAAAADLDTNLIQKVTGLTGKMNTEEGVFKVSAPRTDLKVSVDKWQMPPFMGLTSWAAFKQGMKEDAMVMGDLVLFQDEVNPVMSVLFENGVEVTALHNHFFYDNPKVYFMHIGGEGRTEKLAQGVKAALARTKEIRSAQSQPAESFGRAIPASSSISADALQQILTAKPDVKDGMAKFVFGRVTKMPCGCEAGKEMGVSRHRRQRGRRWRLRMSGAGTPTRAALAAQKRHRHRRHPSAHDVRAAALRVPALLGPR